MAKKPVKDSNYETEPGAKSSRINTGRAGGIGTSSSISSMNSARRAGMSN